MIDLTGAMDFASGLMREAQKQLAEKDAEIERLRGALSHIWTQAANRCPGDGEIALLADLEKIQGWAEEVLPDTQRMEP